MKETSLRSSTPVRHPYVAWQPSIERDPEFNPFVNVVDRLSGEPLVKRPLIRETT
jgi:hypothetical protein